jgi:Xaa-Pro aminopeptidase
MSGYVGDSFETISSTGANAAVIHYKAEHGNCKVIDPKEVYLCDTGGQYVDGTTDITRTVHVGTPGEEERRAYTRVLQGHVALARAVFPAGTPGIMLEMLARGPLWRDGLNYLHGTGHGIGSFLNVHEGPFGVSGGAVSADKLLASARARRMVLAPILPGYHLSNEPGFYRDGSFGIRLESDLVVEKVETKYAWGSRDFLGLKYLTLVPFCRALIETSLLAPEETEWIDAFHAKCAQELSGAELFRAAAAPSCGGDEAALSADVEAAQAWLKRETAPLVRAVGSSSSSSSRGTKRGKPGT